MKIAFEKTLKSPADVSRSDSKPVYEQLPYYRERARIARAKAFASVGRWLRDTVHAQLQALGKRQRERNALAELRRLSDHELRDIGLYRGEVELLMSGGIDTAGLDSERRQAKQGRETINRLPSVSRLQRRTMTKSAVEMARKCA